ncbi:DUF4476 domain-containing protein [Anabaena sp. UHCC 0253]|nr:DUF4476 domain-containing protein [Anabaena sp. UHCC 0253]MTJ06765.1 DUF4476 domain-containing protein [Anabaena sp. UHCC 0204]MTJ54996.1 DUF4476 domain-containing protein [Anabaena sp. UHCC 0253]
MIPISTNAYLNKYLGTLLLSLGIAGWSLPAQASPQLLYEFLEVNGNLSTCLNQAETAIKRSGLVRQNTRQNSINAQGRDITATVYCRRINPQLSEAVLMVAGTNGVSTANFNSVFNSIVKDIDESRTTTVSQSTSTPISDAAFGQLIDALERNWANPLEFLAQAVPQNYFTAAQATQIVKKINFESRKISAAVLLYPQVVDRGNWFVVEQTFTFESQRRELRRQIANLSNK